MYYAKTALKLREQIIKFSGELSVGWPKVALRFLSEAVYWIQARQSIHLTEIARALGEKISLKKTQYRLSRQLGREDLERRVLNGTCQMGAQRVEKKTLLIIDLSDIRKNYARKIEHLACVRGFGQDPMMLLTDLRVTKSRKSLWRIIELYLTIWRIEETIRFIKQSYQVEDIRLLTYQRLQNIMAILTAVSYSAMVYLGLRTKLRVLAWHVMGTTRRLFGIPDFHFYALADGIREYLFGRQKGLQGFHYQWIEENNQLNLFDP